MTSTPHSPNRPAVGCGIVPPDLLRRIAEGAGPDHPDVPDEAAAAAQRTLDADAQLRQLREVVAERGRGDLRGPIPGLQNLRDQRSRGQASRPPRPSRSSSAPSTTRSRRPSSRQARPRRGQARDVRRRGQPGLRRARRDVAALLVDAFERDSLDAKGLELRRRPCTTASSTTTRSGTASRWSSATATAATSTGFTIERRRHRPRADPRRDAVHRGPRLRQASPARSTSRCPTCSARWSSSRSLGQDAADADWLIGAGTLHRRRSTGVALRSMKAPGTAYDDPVLGKDPQPADMDGYVELPTDRSTTTAASTPTPASPTGRSTSPPPAIGGNALGGRRAHLVRRRHRLDNHQGHRLRRLRGADRRGRGGPVRRRQQPGRGGPGRVADREGHQGRRRRRPPRRRQRPRRPRRRRPRAQSRSPRTPVAAAVSGRAASPWRS